MKFAPSIPIASILYRYTPELTPEALKLTVCEPATMFPFRSVATSCPSTSNTFKLTFESTASLKFIVVLGLNGFG